MNGGLGLRSRDRRTLIVGTVAVGTLMLISRGGPAYRAWEDVRRTEASVLTDRIAFANRSSRELPALRDSLRVRRMRFAAIDSSLIGGNSPAAAAANLASAVEDFADDAPMRISALQIHADTAARPGLSRVAVRMTAVADVAGLAAFLRAVDGGVRHLAVRELAISQAEPAAPDSKPEMLRIDVLIEGLAQIVPSVVR